jgi:hypothetical protein
MNRGPDFKKQTKIMLELEHQYKNETGFDVSIIKIDNCLYYDEFFIKWLIERKTKINK